jgi:23S rRNA pseudouridine2605 synthase
MQINKYIAHSGICSRRKADEAIAQGLITINGYFMTDVTYRVQEGDVVAFEEKIIKPEEHVYIVINKPKGVVTTVEDERDRQTVVDLVKLPKPARLYPIGRLDRQTTGLLLLTNDGEFSQKLAHPSYGVEKKYYVSLKCPLALSHFLALKQGVRLADGFAKPDKIVFVEGSKRKQLIVELHSGKNRIIRRMFAHFQGRVEVLDRFSYANISKKGLKPGEWRHLTLDEVKSLKKNK